MEKRKLERIESYIFDFFHRREANRLLAKEIFEETSEFANAHLVRAFEDLEKKWRLVVRYTDEGNDWVSLTPEGAAYAGVHQPQEVKPHAAVPHPPRSIT